MTVYDTLSVHVSWRKSFYILWCIFLSFLYIRMFNICLLSKFCASGSSKMYAVSVCWVSVKLNSSEADTHGEIEV